MAGNVCPRLCDALDRRVISDVDTRSIEPHHRNAFQQIDPLLPVVEGCQRTDHAHDRVGKSAIIARRVGKMFNLSDHVVAEKPHQSALEWRQLVKQRRAIHGQEIFHGLQHAAVGIDVNGEGTLNTDAAIP